MSDELQQRFTQASERFTKSITDLAVFTGNLLADLVDRTVDTVERSVNHLTGESAASASSTSNDSSTAARSATRKRTRSATRTTRSTRTKASSRITRTTISDEVQAKIREGFDRGMTTKEIADFAGVSQSSAVRYTAPLRK